MPTKQCDHEERIDAIRSRYKPGQAFLVSNGDSQAYWKIRKEQLECSSCRNQEAAKEPLCPSCSKPYTYDPSRYQGGYFCENAGCPAYQGIPAHGAAKGEEVKVGIDLGGLNGDTTTMVFIKQRKDGTTEFLANLQGEDADAVIAWHEQEIALTRSRSEKVGEAKGWRDAAALPDKKKPDEDCGGEDYALGVMAGWNAAREFLINAARERGIDAG